MNAMAKAIVFVILGLLALVSSGYAATVDSLQRSLYLGAKEIQSNTAGAFGEGLSWPGAGLAYNSDLGRNMPGAQVYQYSDVVNGAETMTAGGLGGLNVWWPQFDERFSIRSRFSLGFTPLTAASYDFWTNNDGGDATLKDMVTGDYLFSGNGFLIAGHQYLLEADASILDLRVENYSAYWSIGLTVQEQPAAVPLPGTLLLLAPGLAGLAALKKKLKK